jgi:predicted MPP superfamily phosphohydrolase
MVLLISLAGSLFHWYVARKAIHAFTEVTGWRRKRIQWTVIAVMAAATLYPVVILGSYVLEAGPISTGSSVLLDTLVIYPFWIGIILSVQLALALLVIDLIRIGVGAVYKKERRRLLAVQSWLIVVLIFIAAGYVVARVYNDTFTVRTKQTELTIRDLPPDLEGLKIAHIADLQVDSHTNGKKLRAYIDEVNRLQPDLILFCGDLVTSGTAYIEQGGEAMGEMKSRLGTFSCLGDHDYFSDRQRVSRALAKNGVTVIEDAVATVPVGSSHLVITGVTNVYRDRVLPETIEKLESSRSQAPLNIFITHQPSPWLVDIAAKSGYDLFLAGHTHGGQIAFPLPGFILTGSLLETPYVTGFSRVGSMLVSTNNGLGLTLAPIRYHAPAEVTLIVVRRS